MRITVYKTTTDKLYREEYEFYVMTNFSNVLEIVLDSVSLQERQTTKHKFKNVKTWYRLKNKDNTLSVDEIKALISGGKMEEIKEQVLEELKTKYKFTGSIFN